MKKAEEETTKEEEKEGTKEAWEENLMTNWTNWAKQKEKKEDKPLKKGIETSKKKIKNGEKGAENQVEQDAMKKADGAMREAEKETDQGEMKEDSQNIRSAETMTKLIQEWNKMMKNFQTQQTLTQMKNLDFQGQVWVWDKMMIWRLISFKVASFNPTSTILSKIGNFLMKFDL